MLVGGIGVQVWLSLHAGEFVVVDDDDTICVRPRTIWDGFFFVVVLCVSCGW